MERDIEVIKNFTTKDYRKLTGVVYFTVESSYLAIWNSGVPTEIKLGKAKNLRHRQSGAKSSNSDDIYLLYYIETETPHEIESRVKTLLNDKHINGEFYRLNKIIIEATLWEYSLKRLETPFKVNSPIKAKGMIEFTKLIELDAKKSFKPKYPYKISSQISDLLKAKERDFIKLLNHYPNLSEEQDEIITANFYSLSLNYKSLNVSELAELELLYLANKFIIKPENITKEWLKIATRYDVIMCKSLTDMVIDQYEPLTFLKRFVDHFRTKFNTMVIKPELRIPKNGIINEKELKDALDAGEFEYIYEGYKKYVKKRTQAQGLIGFVKIFNILFQPYMLKLIRHGSGFIILDLYPF